MESRNLDNSGIGLDVMSQGKSAWEYLRSGEGEQAIGLFEKAYVSEPDAGNIIRLGIGYLWTKDYQAAYRHFRDAINTYGSPADIFHGMAGVAKWCVDEPDAAVDLWRAGFSAPYAIGASIVRLPLLLFASSILKPAVVSRKEAKEILRERIENPLIENFPGPLAKFVLNELKESDLEPLWIGNIGNGKRGVMLYRRWLTEFYRLILAAENRGLNFGQFNMVLQQMIDTSRQEWSEDRQFALVLQCEEFFIARHEALSATRRF